MEFIFRTGAEHSRPLRECLLLAGVTPATRSFLPCRSFLPFCEILPCTKWKGGLDDICAELRR